MLKMCFFFLFFNRSTGRLFLHLAARETIIHFFSARDFLKLFVLKKRRAIPIKPCRARENNPALCTDDSSSCPTDMQQEQRGIFFSRCYCATRLASNCWTLMHFYRGGQTRLRPCTFNLALRVSLSAQVCLPLKIASPIIVANSYSTRFS